MKHLLQSLLQIHSPSGDEGNMKDFLLEYVSQHQEQWAVKPEVIHGPEFQDCLILAFGKPQTAVFAHMDTTGFTVRYQDQLIPIGGPEVHDGDVLVGSDDLGPIECKVKINEEYQLFYEFGRAIQSGTSLTYRPDMDFGETLIKAPYLDNRVGLLVALKLAETLENGVLVFSAWEEHGGGSVPFLVKYLYDRWQIGKALISDVTWATDGVSMGEGVVISLRDRNIPRRSFLNQIIEQAQKNGIKFQKEVESSGSSDGREIQQSPYPIDWCFIGPPELNPHGAVETVHIEDVESTIELYKMLMSAL